MNPNGNPQNLTPWKKGQAGNPRGGSAKVRNRRYLRDLLRDQLSEPADPERVKDIIGDVVVDLDHMDSAEALEHMKALIAKGLSQGEVIAAQIVKDAMGDDHKAAKARDQIISTEPKTIAIEKEDPRSPDFVPSEADQVALEKDAQSGDLVH